MKKFIINEVEFDLEFNYIQVKKNYGNRIYFKEIQTARQIWEAIKNGDIKVDKDYWAFPTINAIKSMVDGLEKGGK